MNLKSIPSEVLSISLLWSWCKCHLCFAPDSLVSRDEWELTTAWTFLGLASKVTEQPKVDAPTWKRSGARGHTWEEHSAASLSAGWQEMRATKLKTQPFKITFHAAILPKALREKKQFQHGVSMERLQEDYLESYKKAMLWNVFLYSNTSMIGMISCYLKIYFYKEVWATFGFISYESMKGFRTHAEFLRHSVGLGEFFSFLFASGRFYQKSLFKKYQS